MADRPTGDLDAAILRLVSTVSEREHMGVRTQDVLDVIAAYREREEEVRHLYRKWQPAPATVRLRAARAIRAIKAEGAAEERAKVVAFFRSDQTTKDEIGEGVAEFVASLIEAGDHDE